MTLEPVHYEIEFVLVEFHFPSSSAFIWLHNLKKKEKKVIHKRVP